MLMLLLQLIVILNSPCEWNFNVLGGVLSAICLLFKRSVSNGIKVDNQISNWNQGMRVGCLGSTSLLNMNERCSLLTVEKNKWKAIFSHCGVISDLLARNLDSFSDGRTIRPSSSSNVWDWNNISRDFTVYYIIQRMLQCGFAYNFSAALNLLLFFKKKS